MLISVLQYVSLEQLFYFYHLNIVTWVQMVFTHWLLRSLGINSWLSFGKLRYNYCYNLTFSHQQVSFGQ